MTLAPHRERPPDQDEARSWPGFRWLVLGTALSTYALIILGGVVRTTESGDACPDWPRCHGELIPPLEPAVLIEFSHRLLASLVGFLILAVAIAAWRTQRHRPVVFWGSLAAVGLVAGQIVLGGMTVLNELPSSLVTAHLALATFLLAALAVIAFASFELRAPERARPDAASFRNLAFVAALAVFGLMLSGSYASGSGAGLAFRDWPLMDGRLMPEGGRLAMIHATHRFVALAVGVLLVYVVVRAWRSHRDEPGIVHGATFALVLYVAQAFVGAANIWTLLQPAAGAAHLALAAAIWAVLVLVALFAHHAAQPAPERARAVASRPDTPAMKPSGAVPARGPS
ncbi:MAG: COX15/CtaA family protein [Dehalococcoidia bacterium]